MEPPFDSVFGRVEVVVRCLVERLQESGVDEDESSRFEHSLELLDDQRWISVVLERVHRDNEVKEVRRERELVGVSDDVGVVEQGAVELDHVLLTRGGAAATEV